MTHTVTSPDGTTIGYRQVGHGPGLVILHGAMETGASHDELAAALSGRFTCYLPDRRGRGASGPYGPDDGLDREVEDLGAVLDATGARYVLGVSSGAIIALTAALTRPDIHRSVIFEPPLSVAGSNPTTWLPRFDAQIARGDITGALITGMKRTKMGPPWLTVLPAWLLRPLTAAMLTRTPEFRDLAPTLHHDVRIVEETADRVSGFAKIRSGVLLLGGGKSPAYLKQALTALASALPAAPKTELEGLGHGATGPAAMGGAPERVAREVAAFLAGEPAYGEPSRA